MSGRIRTTRRCCAASPTSSASATIAGCCSRAEAFRDCIEASQLGRVVLDRSDVSGYAAGRFGNEIVTLPTRPDAVFCSTDVTAIGVLDGLRLDRRLAVPEEVGVVGFGDVPAAAWASHEPASVRLPIERMVDESVNALLDDHDARRPNTIAVEAEIVWCRSLRQAAITR